MSFSKQPFTHPFKQDGITPYKNNNFPIHNAQLQCPWHASTLHLVCSFMFLSRCLVVSALLSTLCWLLWCSAQHIEINLSYTSGCLVFKHADDGIRLSISYSSFNGFLATDKILLAHFTRGASTITPSMLKAPVPFSWCPSYSSTIPAVGQRG